MNVTPLHSRLLAVARRSLTLRFVALYGAVFVLGLALSGAFAATRMAKLVDTTIDTFGNTVVSQLAHTALDAVMQQDQIALQAHLSRLLKAPGVVSAAVFDVQNRLLAQAGATPYELHNRRYLHNFTTTMALGDNIIGRVVVTLDTAGIERVLPEMHGVLAAGCVVVLILLLVISRRLAVQLDRQQLALSRALRDTLPPAVLQECLPESGELVEESDIRKTLERLREHVRQVQEPSRAALLSAAAELTSPGIGKASLLLECSNLDLLQRQVSRERLRALLDQVQQLLEKTCRLYHGQRIPVSGSCLKVVFSAADSQEAEAVLQAACCAHVLAGALKSCRDEQLGIALHWNVALDWHPACDNDLLCNRQQAADEQRGEWLCRQVGSGQLAVSVAAEPWLRGQDKLTLAADHGEGGKAFFRVVDFAPVQRQLLDRQVSQLLDS